jgi:tetratricopeptide (TPR) repeat protein
VQPLLLVFEDLHWIDSETQAVLDSLVDGLPTARLLLLVNYRPEYQHGWGSKTYYSQLRIDPLPPESAEELLHALLGNDATLKPLKQLLIDRTEGNPFFLEESVRALVETKALEGEWGRYHIGKTIESTQVPVTVQAVLAARIDRLSAEDKRLLQSGAVIGKDAPFVLLQAVADLSEEDLRRSLAHLQTGEFLYETSLFPEPEYTFTHALTHQVAYGSLLQERRRMLHARIVEAVERLYADRLAEHVERLAHHAFRGEVWDKAVTYLWQAGNKAAGRSAYREAVPCLKQALEALGHLPQSREMIEQDIDLRFDIRNALFPLGEFDQISDYLREAETLVQPLNDQRRLGWLSVYLANDFGRKADYDRSIESARRAIAIAEDLKDFALPVVANFYLGLSYIARGDYRRAMDYLRWNVEFLQRERIYERVDLPGLPSVLSRTYMALCLAELGEFAEASARGEEAIGIAKAIDHAFSVSTAYFGVGYVHLRKGNIEKAIITLEHGLRLCQIWNIRVLLPRTASALGYAYALSERITEALPLLEQAVEQCASIRTVRLNSYLVRQLGEGYLLAGRIEDAIVHAGRALDFARQHKERGHEAYILRLLGEIAAREDPSDVGKAEDHYRQALALAEELGMRPFIAHCHVGLGKLYRRSGNLPLAKEHLHKGVALMREMEMGVWLESAEAELKELG